MTAINPNIPLEVLQQFLIESQPQALGYAPDSINAPYVGPTGDTTNVTNIQQAAPAQSVVNRCTMVSLQFTDNYSGNSNPNRSYLLIQNNGAGTMSIVLAGVAVAGAGIQIVAGGYWEPLVVPVNTFYILGTGVVVEGTTI